MEIIIAPSSPIQQLADYIFENYRHFESRCGLHDVPVSFADCADCHSKAYYSRGKPKYDCDNFKFAYLWRYLSAHIAQTEQPLSKCVIPRLEKEGDIRALSLGGGPGTEAIALMNQLKARGGDYSVVFDNLEQEQSWNPIYDDLVNRFAGYLGNISIDARFHQFSAIASLPSQRWIHPEGYHVVFAGWILSELDHKVERARVLSEALGLACHNGSVVITERIEKALINEISEFVQRSAGWSLVGSEDNCQSHAGVSFPEEFLTTFKPKLSYQTAYWVLQKH